MEPMVKVGIQIWEGNVEVGGEVEFVEVGVFSPRPGKLMEVFGVRL